MKQFLIILSAFFSVTFCFLAPPGIAADQLSPEARLLEAIRDIHAVDFSAAELKLNSLIKEIPDFKLAHLVLADVHMSKVQGINSTATGLQDDEQKKSMLAEIKNRYQAANDLNPVQGIPSVLARLDKHYPHAIVVDLNKSRLYLFDNKQKQPRLVKDFFISMGRGGAGKVNEGDLKTPLGVYFIQSYISPEQLADKYGAGAYPINYPNAWDRMNGRTGHGIWLHGTRSGTYNRPPLASEGCVVLPNDDLLNVGTYIDLKNTPMLIGEDIEWLSKEEWLQHKDVIAQIHVQWKQDWESLKIDDYLKHYSRRFTNGKKDYTLWSDHKRRVSKHKSFVKVELSNVSLLIHPNEEVMVATYLQSYSSDNFSSKSWKRQYWNKEEDGEWRIVFEGEISAPISPLLALKSKALVRK